MNRDNLLRRISALQFSAWEMHLYLNTHPKDTEIIKLAKETDEKLHAVIAEYEKEFGPLTYNAKAGNAEEWLRDPWPWDIDFGGVI